MTNTKQSILGTSLLALALLAVSPGSMTADDDADPELKPYPLTTCLVSSEKLGEMGEPYVINHKGQEIKFCCKSCVKDFNKEPKKYLAKLQKPAKPAQTE